MEIFARDFTPESLLSVLDTLPKTARDLVEIMGAAAAAALFNARPGYEIRIPKHAGRHPEGASRWSELAGIVGEAGMRALSARYGGDVLAVPVCRASRLLLRDREIRAEYDRLTCSHGYSGRRAVAAIGDKFAPITSRAIEKILNRAP